MGADVKVEADIVEIGSSVALDPLLARTGPEREQRGTKSLFIEYSSPCPYEGEGDTGVRVGKREIS